MRVSDLIISNNYISNTNLIKERIARLNRQILSGSKIEKPSDSPTGASRLIKISDQMGQIESYQKNIQNSLSFLNETVFAMETIQSEVLNMISKLTDLQNPVNQGNLDLYADMIDNALQIMVDTANSKSDGKYIFGGTDYSGKPFYLSSDNQSYEMNNNISGKVKVKISQSVIQQVNLPGMDLFGTVVSPRGIFSLTDSIGTITSDSSTVYDNLGNEYQLQTSYQKTADNTYEMTYDIIDSGGSSVFSSAPAVKTLQFNSQNGNLVSVDGSSTNLSFEVNVPSNRIHFSIDLKNLSEKNSSTSINTSINQSTDIFNTLKQLSDKLRNGIIPTDDDIAAVEKFNSRIISKQSEIGNVMNQMSTIDSMLVQQNFNLQDMAQKESGVDLAKAIIELQNQDYLLQVSQKLGSIILPQSLLNYL